MLIIIVHTVFRVYYALILLRVLMSWVQVGDNFATRFIYEMTEPVLGLFRRLIPPRPSFPLDLSPIFAYVVLQLAESLLVRLLLLL